MDSIILRLLYLSSFFFSRFGGISGVFGRAMVRILARRSRAKILMARPNEPEIPPKREAYQKGTVRYLLLN